VNYNSVLPVTPVQRVDQKKLPLFCRYYCQDDSAGRLMTQTLATLPPSQRAPFSRLQASIRSAYHRSVNARRHAEFQAHLSATTPGGSLMPHARSDPRGNAAQKGGSPIDDAVPSALQVGARFLILHLLQNDTSEWSASSATGVIWACLAPSHFSRRTSHSLR